MKKILKVLTIFMMSISSISCSVGATNDNDSNILKIYDHFNLYSQKCIAGRNTKSVAPVENWRTKLMNLLNNLPEKDRKEMFIRLYVKRISGQTLPNNVTFDLLGCSRIVRIPCPSNREYTPKLILNFIKNPTQTPSYKSNGSSILAMKYGNQIIII